MNLLLHGLPDPRIEKGDSIRDPKFPERAHKWTPAPDALVPPASRSAAEQEPERFTHQEQTDGSTTALGSWLVDHRGGRDGPEHGPSDSGRATDSQEDDVGRRHRAGHIADSDHEQARRHQMKPTLCTYMSHPPTAKTA
jgi:hypothetical protein